jgi:Protein of unknown function (DUF1569)
MLNDPACKAEIVKRFRNLGPDAVPLWGKMTVSQMICHLNDSFLGVMGDKPMKVLRFSFWRLTKSFALSGRMDWPHGVKTRPEFEQGVGGTPPAEFATDLQRLLATVERFTQDPRGFEFRPHPMFGRMTEKEWMRWGYLHCDHHLRQFGQ